MLLWRRLRAKARHIAHPGAVRRCRHRSRGYWSPRSSSALSCLRRACGRHRVAEPANPGLTAPKFLALLLSVDIRLILALLFPHPALSQCSAPSIRRLRFGAIGKHLSRHAVCELLHDGGENACRFVDICKLPGRFVASRHRQFHPHVHDSGLPFSPVGNGRGFAAAAPSRTCSIWHHTQYCREKSTAVECRRREFGRPGRWRSEHRDRTLPNSKAM
jgi:hypothetical protein